MYTHFHIWLDVGGDFQVRWMYNAYHYMNSGHYYYLFLKRDVFKNLVVTSTKRISSAHLTHPGHVDINDNNKDDLLRKRFSKTFVFI